MEATKEREYRRSELAGSSALPSPVQGRLVDLDRAWGPWRLFACLCEPPHVSSLTGPCTPVIVTFGRTQEELPHPWPEKQFAGLILAPLLVWIWILDWSKAQNWCTAPSFIISICDSNNLAFPAPQTSASLSSEQGLVSTTNVQRTHEARRRGKIQILKQTYLQITWQAI